MSTQEVRGLTIPLPVVAYEHCRLPRNAYGYNSGPGDDEVSIKIGANMPELMKNSAKLPLKILVHEARKIKTENVEHLLAASVN